VARTQGVGYTIPSCLGYGLTSQGEEKGGVHGGKRGKGDKKGVVSRVTKFVCSRSGEHSSGVSGYRKEKKFQRGGRGENEGRRRESARANGRLLYHRWRRKDK